MTAPSLLQPSHSQTARAQPAPGVESDVGDGAVGGVAVGGVGGVGAAVIGGEIPIVAAAVRLLQAPIQLDEDGTLSNGTTENEDDGGCSKKTADIALIFSRRAELIMSHAPSQQQRAAAATIATIGDGDDASLSTTAVLLESPYA